MSKRAMIALVFSLGLIAAARIRPEELLNMAVPDADKKLAYGSDPLQFGELRLPKTKGPHPVVILVHGGCWVDKLPGGNPRITTYELLRPLAAALTEAGIATWNIEYRRAGNPGGGWPGSYQDLSQAADFLRQISASTDLDLRRVVLVGHSSGGQLALWMAARSKLPASSPLYSKNPLLVKAVIDIDAPPDLASTQPLERKFCPVPGVSEFLGGTPADQPERYRDGSALSFLPLGVPQWIVAAGLLHSAMELATSYEKEAKAKGDRITIVTLDGSGHFDMLKPDSGYGKTLLETIVSVAR